MTKKPQKGGRRLLPLPYLRLLSEISKGGLRKAATLLMKSEKSGLVEPF